MRRLCIGFAFFYLLVIAFSITAAESDLVKKLRGPSSTVHHHRDLSDVPNPLTQTVDPARYQNVRWEDHADPKIQKYFRSRQLYVSALNATMHQHVPGHKKAWQALEEVNGLKNEEVLIFVTSTSAKDEIYLWERIIPSARTWMKFFANVYVIVEDNFMVRYSLRHCHVTEYAHYTTFACHNEPVYLLSRNCTNEYYGAAGPCCKVDDAFNFLVNDNPKLFRQIKYVLHGDDDTYFRPDAVLDWLSHVEKAGVSDFPMVGNSNPGHPEHNKGHWHIKDGTCTEIQACGWFQPLMINHKALEILAHPVSKYAITDTCKKFDMTHDAGLEIFFWIFSFYHIYIPMTNINNGHDGYKKAFNPWLTIVHNIRHSNDDKCRNGDESKWPESLRYNQKVAIGCGDVGTPGPFHERDRLADMYDAYQYFHDHGEDPGFGLPGQHDWYKGNVTVYTATDGTKRVKEILPLNTPYKGTDPVEERILPLLIQLKGYETTVHSKQHDIVHDWFPFTHNDCKIKGIIP